MFVMAGVVTTALYVPIVGLLALLAIGLFGVSLHSFITFGEALGAVEGVLVWWAVLFVPALAYSALMMPWRAKKD